MRVTLIVVLRCFDLVDLREEEKLRKYLRPESLVLGISTSLSGAPSLKFWVDESTRLASRTGVLQP